MKAVAEFIRKSPHSTLILLSFRKCENPVGHGRRVYASDERRRHRGMPRSGAAYRFKPPHNLEGFQQLQYGVLRLVPGWLLVGDAGLIEADVFFSGIARMRCAHRRRFPRYSF